MKKVENYRPAVIEFTADSQDVPKTLGSFKKAEEAQKFINEKFIAVPLPVDTERVMDDYEKDSLRWKYINELEVVLPEYETKYQQACIASETAKEAEKKAKEMVTASRNYVETLSREARAGVVDISLDQAFTWQIPFNGNYYYYTYMDGKLQLAKVQAIPDHQKGDIFNANERNSLFFQELKNAANE